jgi:hypothetical protein
VALTVGLETGTPVRAASVELTDPKVRTPTSATTGPSGNGNGEY